MQDRIPQTNRRRVSPPKFVLRQGKSRRMGSTNWYATEGMIVMRADQTCGDCRHYERMTALTGRCHPFPKAPAPTTQACRFWKHEQ